MRTNTAQPADTKTPVLTAAILWRSVQPAKKLNSIAARVLDQKSSNRVVGAVSNGFQKSDSTDLFQPVIPGTNIGVTMLSITALVA